jgi:myosin heavy subunit
MAKQIKRQDISEEDLFKSVRESAEKTLKTLSDMNNVLKSNAQILSTELKNATTASAKGINELVAATEKANKMKGEAVKIDQETIKIKQELLKVDELEEKVKQQKLKTEAQVNKEKERQAKASEKSAKAAQNEASAYKQLEKNTRELKNQSKELGAQMLKLEQSGKKNSAEYKKLAAQYKQVTTAAQQGDTQLKKLDKTVGDNFRNVGNYSKAMGGLKSVLGAFGVGFGVAQIKGFITETIELSRVQEKAVAQVAAGLASTGGAVGFTLDELKAKASALQKETLFGDETILTDLTSVMLTFTNVTGKAFDGAQQAALDLSTRMGGDLKGAAVQLGKALNDPVRGVTALRKVGVSFTESQLDQIKVLTESGDLMSAQNIILDEMSHQFGGSAKAAAEADGGIQQLSNAFGDAKEEIGKMLLEGLKPTIQGLKEFFENLSTEDIRGFVQTLGSIFGVVMKIVKAFIAYKTVMFAFKMKDRITEMITYNKALKNGSAVADGAASGVKKFGAALKGIGLGLAITLAIELATALYDIASGAKAAREEKERMDRAMAAGTASAEKVLAKSNENLKEQLRLLDLEIRQRKANGEDEKKLTAEKLKREQELTNNELNAIKSRISFKEKAMADALRLEEKINTALTVGLKSSAEYAALNKEINETYGMTTKGVQGLDKALEKVTSRSTRLTQEIVELSEGKKELAGLSQELAVQNLENAVTTQAVTKETKKETKEIKEKAKTMKSANDEIERMNKLMQETEDLIQEIAQYESEANLQAAVDAQMQSIQKSGKYSLDTINMLIDAEHELQKAILERTYLEAVENAETQQEVINARMRYDFELEKLDKKRKEKSDQIRTDLETSQEDWVEKNLDNNEKVAKSDEKTTDYRIALVNALADAQKAASDRRMKLIDQEIAAAEKQFDYFQDLAANGNINAKESLAEQQRLIVEANKQKEKEMRRQARIELAVSAYNAYQKNVEDPNVKNPLAKTITDITLLSQFIQNIPAFFDGTEDTGKNGQGVDGRGGFHAVLHPNERVVPKSLNEQIGSLSNSELARIASEYNTGALIRKGEGAMQIGGAWQTAAIVGKLDALEKAIKSKPETNIELGEIVGGAMEIVKTTRKGNDVIYNRYRIK